MATFEAELIELRQRVEHLESTVRQLVAQERSVLPDQLVRQDNLIARLKAEGVVRDPTSEERGLADEWQALPEEEKQAIQWELDHLPPGPMVSDIIIGNRC